MSNATHKTSPRAEATITVTPAPTHDTIEHDHELSQSISELTRIMRHRTSRKYRFLIGIVTGLGTVIGATILAGAIIYILSLMVAQIDFSEMPIIQGLIEQAHLSTQP